MVIDRDHRTVVEADPVGPIRSVDWAAAAALPLFAGLRRARRRFVVPALVVSLGFYLAVTVFVGLAPGIASRPVIGAVNLGYILIFATYVITWIVAVLYVHFSSTVLDPKAKEIVDLICGEGESCKD